MFSALIWIVSLIAGFLGSLTGLGGGVVIVPLLAIVFKVDIHYAIGTSLIAVIGTSSGAAAAYLKEGYTNIRIGIFLQVATTMGAICGAILATKITGSAIAVIFGLVLLYSAYFSSRPKIVHQSNSFPTSLTAQLTARLKLDSYHPTPSGLEHYTVRGVSIGFGLMFIAGILSGLLGIGSGAVKVLAMDQAMGIPFKVSTATSNFMIGVTAAASVGVYLRQGYIDPGLAMPVVLGVLLGAFLGTHVLMKIQIKVLRLVFSITIFVLAVEMIYKGFTGGL